MFDKIALATSLIAVISLSQCSIARADSVNDEINSTNQLSEQIEDRTRQPQPAVSGGNEVTTEVQKANALAGEVENQVRRSQSTDGSSNEVTTEVKQANDIARAAEKYVRETQPVDSVSSSSSFVTGAVRESNRIANEVERNNNELMKRSRQTETVAESRSSDRSTVVGSNNRNPSDNFTAIVSPSNSGTVSNPWFIPIGVGLVAIAGVCYFVSNKNAA